MFDQLHNHQQCAGIPIMEMDGRWKAHLQQAPNCPRCASTNTKFCYYNNYSLAQPRYFCKGCRRYWTKGGSLRNVPVGGGCRKSRRSRSKHLSHNPGPAAGPQLEATSTTSSPEIDLAAVFARYVNQDQQSQGLETTSSPVDQVATRDDVTGQGQYYLFDQVANVGSFDQGLDVFWSSTSTEDGSSLSTANWEPMTAQQELDYSSSPLALYAAAASVLDDQFTTSVSGNSLLGEFNWSCLDDQLAGYMADQL